MGYWGRGLTPRNLRDSPTVDEAPRLKLQHRLVLDLFVGSFTGSKTDTIEKVFGQRTPTATSIHQCSLADHQHEVTKNRTLRGTRSRLALRRRALRGFSWHTERRPRLATVASDGRFMGQLFDWKGLLCHKRPTGMISIFEALAFHCHYGDTNEGAIALSGPLPGG